MASIKGPSNLGLEIFWSDKGFWEILEAFIFLRNLLKLNMKFYISYKNGERDFASRYYEADNLLVAEELITSYKEKTYALYDKKFLKKPTILVVGLDKNIKKDLTELVDKVYKKKFD